MNTRIIDVMEVFKLSPSEFADKLEVQRSAISHIISGRNKPGVDMIIKLLTSFPEVSPDWLLLGKGEMFKAGKTGSLNQTEYPKVPQISPSSDDHITDSSDKTVQKTVVKAATMGSDRSIKNRISRITVYYDDHTFEDFGLI